MTIPSYGLTEKVMNYKPPHPPVEEFEPAKDRAAFANPEKKSLFSAATKVRHLTPHVGTELVGVQLSKLTPDQKDELALLAAERGVVFFREQDITLDEQYELTKHYGIQDRDPSQVNPRHVTIIGRDFDIRGYMAYGADFHSDHSYEANPPAYTMLRMVKTPDFGGDTIFTSQTALFDKLSPSFQRMFEGLNGVHSSEHGFMNSVNSGGAPFRGPVRREHPLVRTHPVTKVKSLFYNPSFIIHLAGLKAEEANHTLSFLREHLHAADDLSVRWKWEPGSVAFWDNRVIAHRAIPGGYDTSQREGNRTAIFGERPFFDPNGETLSERAARLATPAVNGDAEKDGEKNIAL